MNEPNLAELREKLDVPSDAVFYGWLIHNPIKDDFLHKDKSKKGMIISTAWIMNPEKALRFTRYIKAHKTLIKLELEHKAVIVPAFDIGKQIMVALDTEYVKESDNPYRNLADIMSQHNEQDILK